MCFGVLCHALIVLSIHRIRQLGSQSIKLFRNINIIEMFPFEACFRNIQYRMYVLLLRHVCAFFGAVYSSSFMVPLLCLDRYIHVKYTNEYSSIFTPIRFNVLFILSLAGSLCHSYVSTAAVMMGGALKAIRYTLYRTGQDLP